MVVLYESTLRRLSIFEVLLRFNRLTASRTKLTVLQQYHFLYSTLSVLCSLNRSIPNLNPCEMLTLHFRLLSIHCPSSPFH